MDDCVADSWTLTTLGAVATRLVNGGTPPTENQAYWTGDIPWITGADFTRSGVGEFRRFVSEEATKRTTTNSVDKGSLLIVTRTGVGKLAIAPCVIAISQDITGVYPDRDQVDVEFLYHRMRQGVDDLRKLNQGTSINGIVRNDLISYPLELPPLNQQRRIATILSTVDQAIEQTEALIAKQQRIKTGLMQDLLTRGIDENGNLRSEETHEFKDSPLGRIPVEWDLSELAYAFAEVPRNGIYKPPNQIGSGTVLIGQTSFTKEGRIDYRFARRTTVSPGELKAYRLRNYDILVRRVFATVDGVGLPILVTDLPEAAVYESNMLRLRVDSTKYNPTLLFHWLRSSAIRKRVTASVNASNQTSINQTVLNALPALVIPSDEQDNIVAAISAQETYLNDLARNLGKLHSLKTALMQDLLTGKVSVAPLLTGVVS